MRTARANANSQRVLIVRLGSMGDVIHGLPVAATLKNNFPGWEVDWLIERRWRPLLDNNPHLSRVIKLDTLAWRAAPLAKSSWHELGSAVDELHRRHYDWALDLQGAIKSAVACRLSGAPKILGFEAPWLREPAAGIFYTRRADVRATHVVEANLELAIALGAAEKVFEFPIPPGDPAEIPSGVPAGDLALMNPGAGWPAKQWSAEGYAAICDALYDQFGLSVILNCGPGEIPLAQQVRGLTHRAQPKFFSGSLPGLIALLRRARLVIAPDTGPLHLAAALRVPTVALFGPTDPKRNGPYGNPSRVLRPEHARTSHSRGVADNDGIMRWIQPDAVIEAARELLMQPGNSNTPGSSAATRTPQLTSQHI